MISFVKIGASCSLTKTDNIRVPQGNIRVYRMSQKKGNHFDR